MIKFGTDGWRAIIGESFTFENVRRVAHAHAKVLQRKGKRKVIVGYDNRFLSEHFAFEVYKVFRTLGFECYIANKACTTPMISFAVRYMGFDNGVMITASHNPPEYNGYKIKDYFGGSATPEFISEVEKEISEDIKPENFKPEYINIWGEYMREVKSRINMELLSQRDMLLVHDAMYGSALGTYSHILTGTKISVINIRSYRDPHFGGHAPEPVEKHLQPLLLKVRAISANFGIANDGDGDRIALVDEKGNFINTQLIYVLLLYHLLKNKGLRDGLVVKTVSTTYLADRICKAFGVELKEVAVGFKNINEVILKEKDRILGWQEIIKELEENPQVVGSAERLISRGILKYGIKDKPITLIGINPQREPRASVIERFLVYKRLDKLETNRTGVIIGSLVARSLGIKELGKKLVLVAPNGKSLLVSVEDFFDSGITNIDDTRVYINIKTLQSLLERQGEVNEIVLKIRDVDSAERLARELKEKIPYEVESWQRAYRNFLSIFKIQNIITYMIVFAILTVSAFGIFNIIMMTVLEKKKDIAILMAMGFTRRDILFIFVVQGLIIGLLGAIIGSFLGFGLQEYLESVRLDVEGLIRTKGFVLDRSPILYLYAFAFSLFFSLLASLYPSYRASRLNPVDIFRSQ